MRIIFKYRKIKIIYVSYSLHATHKNKPVTFKDAVRARARSRRKSWPLKQVGVYIK